MIPPSNPTNPFPGGDPNEPQDQPPPDGGGAGVGDVLDGMGAVADAAGEIGGGALEALGSGLETAGGVLEAAGGCLDGCGSCSLAVFIALFLTASAAFAVFK